MKRARRPKGRKASRVVLFELTGKLDGKKAMDGRTVPLKPPVQPDASGEKQDSNGWKSLGRMAAKRSRKQLKRVSVAKFIRSKIRIIKRGLIGALILLMVLWWFGWFGSPDETTTTPTPTESEYSEVGQESEMPETENNISEAGNNEEETVLPVAAKGNAIVIATYNGSDQLGPVKEYFDSMGIETEIFKSGLNYILVSKERFSGKSDPNFTRLEKVIQRAGKEYKTPKGFKSFEFDSIYLINVSKLE